MITIENSIYTFILITFLACQQVPITGRKQMSLVPESDLVSMSKSQYTTFLESHDVDNHSEDAEMVKRVGAKISEAVIKYMNDNGYSSRIVGFEWEFKLVIDEAVNAWCMPGGKVCVYTGILPVTMNENGLAVVLGHEVAHAIARHGNERMSQGLLLQMGGAALNMALSNKSSKTQNLFMQAYGIGIQTGVILPFSRKNELESDKLGLVFMQLAGYDASAAVDFWKRMEKSGTSQPEFLSTHPSHANRVTEINEFLKSDTFIKHSTN
jgi:predicted Zn-dependent protease